MDAWILAHAETVQYTLFFSLLVLFGIIEVVVPARREPMNRPGRWRANLALTTLNILVLGLLPVSLLTAAMWATRTGVGLLNLHAIPLAVFVVGNLLARGFISFATHYLMHKVPVLWRIHRVHHLDTHLDVSTTVRFHPVEFLTALIIGVPLVVGLGLSPWVLMLYEILDAGITLFSHANIRLPRAVDRVLRYIIVTPDLHRIHHSAWQPETDSNFSAVFPIWDIIFGTFRTETREPQATMTLGLEEVRDQRTTRVGWLLGSPLRDLGREGTRPVAPPPGVSLYPRPPARVQEK